MRFEDLILPQVVFEARYKQGYRYLDRCGETLIDIENSIDGWKANEISSARGKMLNESKNLVLNFNSEKMDIVQNDVKNRDVEEFMRQSMDIFNIISKNLGVNEFYRFGLRFWYFYPLDDPDKGRDILKKCKTYNVNRSVLEKMFGKKTKDTNIALVLEDGNLSNRIALSLVFRERKSGDQDKKTIISRRVDLPEIALLIDIDNLFNSPNVKDLSDFLSYSEELTNKNVIDLIRG